MALVDWIMIAMVSLIHTTHSFKLGLHASSRLGRLNLVDRRTRAASTISEGGPLEIHHVEVDLNTGGVGPRPGIDKPPVLLLHGLLGQSRNFATWANELKVRLSLVPICIISSGLNYFSFTRSI